LRLILAELKGETRARPKGVSGATLSSALFKRGLQNRFIQDVRPIKAKLDFDVWRKKAGR
jgi:hypothetical protein